MKISIQTGNVIDCIGYEKGYALFREAGFDAIDWNLDHSAKATELISGSCRGKCIFERPLEDILAYYKEELDAIHANGLEITQAHAPFPPYAANDPELTGYVASITRNMIGFCDKVGCGNLVVHGINPVFDDNDITLEDVREMNIRFYASLIPALLKSNVTVCLENLPVGRNRGMDKLEGICCDPQDAAELIDTLNEMAGREVFGLCLDTGHLNLIRRDPRRYVAVLGRRIKATHLHDNNGFTDEHIVPFSGTMNWKHLCQALHEAGYSGDLSFETFLQTEHVLRFGEDLLLPWLKLIHACGEAFAKTVSP